MQKTLLALTAATLTLPAAGYAASFEGRLDGAYAAQSSDYFSRRERDHKRGYREGRREERVSRNTRVWRGDDGRSYCRRKDGTTGLLIGGAVGGLAGNEIAGRGDKTLGTILGAAGGALLGREIDRGGSRCR
jgi:hypothetical protein